MKCRFVAYLATLWTVLTLNFFLPRLLPGDPLAALLDPESSEYVFEAEVRAALEAYYGLDHPLLQQYAAYLKGAVTGDLGRSIRLNEPGFRVLHQCPDELILCTFENVDNLPGVAHFAAAFAFPLNFGDYNISSHGFGGRVRRDK